MKALFPVILTLGTSGLCAQERPEIPEDLLDDEHFRTESGLNEFTVPSIAKVFNELEKISPLSYKNDHLKKHKIKPFDRSRLALRLGTLIADGFIAVQTGNSDDVPVIASHLKDYAEALAAGDRVTRHNQALLDHAQAKNLPKLKEALAATQRDVERELVGLRDPDLSILISLGGWLQALDASSRAVEAKFTPEKAKILFREDVADYYAESIGSLNPKISEQEHVLKMRELLQGLRNAMVLEPRKDPTLAQVKEITKVAKQLSEIARK